MILFSLRCASGHEFEAWFRDGDGFEAQLKAGEITCPHCGDAQVEKAVMAPRIGRSRGKTPAPSPAQMRAALVELRRQVEANCDYVGERFAEEERAVRLSVAPIKAPPGRIKVPSAARKASRSATCSRISSARTTSKRSSARTSVSISATR